MNLLRNFVIVVAVVLLLAAVIVARLDHPAVKPPAPAPTVESTAPPATTIETTAPPTVAAPETQPASSPATTTPPPGYKLGLNVLPNDSVPLDISSAANSSESSRFENEAEYISEDGSVRISGIVPHAYFKLSKSEKNSISLSEPVTLTLTKEQRGHYARLSFLHASMGIDEQLGATLHYTSGPDQPIQLKLQGWRLKHTDSFNDRLYLAVNAEHHRAKGTVHIFSQTLNTDVTRELESIRFDTPSKVGVIFAVTAIHSEEAVFRSPE